MTSEEEGRIIPVNIEEEMKSSYIDYAMSVIIGRAIPDVRDGLKPVHRRSLFAMGEMGNTHDKPFKKSARVVGDVMGKYHPHGDASIYDTVVKMAQPFAYRHTLVEGQGNFGSIDGDSAAAMRYTEARLDPVAEELLEDIKKETVDFVPNFDESLQEPSVLPGKFPNLLVNGTTGIAVGMATNMPPHNLGEVSQAIAAVIDNPEITTDELMNIIPGPDFPTGGVILGTAGIKNAYRDGRGKVRIRGVAEIDEEGKKSRIIISEIPFQVNKARMIEQMAGLVRDKKIDGISDIRDESDKDGIRVVIELKRASQPLTILNQLYKHTALENTFGIINLSIVDGQPKVLGLRPIIDEYLRHRREVVRRRTEFDLRKAEDRMHILKGLLLALDRIDEVIATIRASKTSEEASTALIEQFGLDAVQADAILKMQLRRLAALEHQKILDERDVLLREIERLSTILADEKNILAVIKGEITVLGEKYANDRRTKITPYEGEIDKEDLIEKRDVVISLTGDNYIKSMPLETYRGQHRGGRGIIGMATKENDVVRTVFTASTHDYLLCFTSAGRVYWLKVYDIPEAGRTSRGKAIVNLLNLNEERVTAIIPVSEFSDEKFFLFATKDGMVVKIPQAEFSRPRANGINAITLRETDELVHVKSIDATSDLILTTRHGQSLRFNIETIPLRHRNALGVIGIKLRYGDLLQDVTVIEKDHLLTITERGYGKRTEFDEFMGHGRATMGVRNIQTDYSAGVVSSKAISCDDEVLLMSSSGIVMRTPASEISIQKRGTRGVRIMKLDNGDSLVGFTIVKAEQENTVVEDEEGETEQEDSSTEKESVDQ
ncbi:DNA gyrase subunit A [Methanogenium organophilum]|uniref:DNA gyrase subunit A n=1 Tax=Methanogenium organophilum TaxID=2199 RepID=A0A9X9S3Z1_METOG|nr:DNA gyrase subunit A [Methanogenium organophilum]WAI01246.1 DNA gyrase subunit A [Methanogenium organophilum]